MTAPRLVRIVALTLALLPWLIPSAIAITAGIAGFDSDCGECPPVQVA